MTDDTELLRQVHPSWVQAGRATSQTFKPTPKDQGKLSTYDGDMIQPEPAWKHYTSKNLASAGVLAVTVSEFKQEDLPAQFDGTDDFPCHVSVDYNGVPEKQIEKKSKRLRDVAHARGWKFIGPTESA